MRQPSPTDGAGSSSSVRRASGEEMGDVEVPVGGALLPNLLYAGEHLRRLQREQQLGVEELVRVRERFRHLVSNVVAQEQRVRSRRLTPSAVCASHAVPFGSRCTKLPFGKRAASSSA